MSLHPRSLRKRLPFASSITTPSRSRSSPKTSPTAYPILKKYNAPGTFFICPGLVNRGAWLWNQESRARLHWMRSGALSELAESLGRPGSNYLQIVERMKLLPTRSRIHVEQVIRDATPQWRPTRAQEIANDLMSWDARKILNPKLITIGAHSTNHPILANCTSEELIHEIVDCGPLIEKHLLKPVDFFCYPNGDFNPLVTRFVEKSYKAATITRSKDLKTKLTSAGVPEEKIHAN
ncbi:MAG: hypothetical protein CMO80_15565 [Verrucomicrobiales bacterium]|nr:hypothetical protein [Verrucomicrobiales bacterium]